MIRTKDKLSILPSIHSLINYRVSVAKVTTGDSKINRVQYLTSSSSQFDQEVFLSRQSPMRCGLLISGSQNIFLLVIYYMLNTYVLGNVVVQVLKESMYIMHWTHQLFGDFRNLSRQKKRTRYPGFPRHSWTLLGKHSCDESTCMRKSFGKVKLRMFYYQKCYIFF